jgi:hypothetical protein
LRESLVEMDVPTRQSYVMAVVRPEERTFASGIHAPGAARRLGRWRRHSPGCSWPDIRWPPPIYVGAAMKIFYDLALVASPSAILKPPEEGIPQPSLVRTPSIEISDRFSGLCCPSAIGHFTSSRKVTSKQLAHGAVRAAPTRPPSRT